MGLFGDAKSEEVSAKPAAEKKSEEAVAPQVEEPSGEPEVIIAEVGKTPDENALVEEASNGENKDSE